MSFKTMSPYTLSVTAGLCNRLRTVMSHLVKAKYENTLSYVIWIQTEKCNGFLSEVFEPIHGIVWNKGPHNIQTRPPHIRNIGTKDMVALYKSLKPLQPLLVIIDELKEKLNSAPCGEGRDSRIESRLGIFSKFPPSVRRADIEENYIAVHIRCENDNKHRRSDKPFIDFINSKDASLQIFIATDTVETQKKYKDMYGNRVVFSVEIQKQGIFEIPFRMSIIDIYVCRDAKYFMGSYLKPFLSSFSMTIKCLRQGVGHKEWTEEQQKDASDGSRWMGLDGQRIDFNKFFQIIEEPSNQEKDE